MSFSFSAAGPASEIGEKLNTAAAAVLAGDQHAGVEAAIIAAVDLTEAFGFEHVSVSAYGHYPISDTDSNGNVSISVQRTAAPVEQAVQSDAAAPASTDAAMSAGSTATDAVTASPDIEQTAPTVDAEQSATSTDETAPVG